MQGEYIAAHFRTADRAGIYQPQMKARVMRSIAEETLEFLKKYRPIEHAIWAKWIAEGTATLWPKSL